MSWLPEIGVAPTRVRSDWGGEFVAASQGGFLRTCVERGIWPEKSAPYNAAQNGKAERGNRLLLEMCRSMLHHASLGKEYWGYAVKYACYIDLHCISTRTKQTPYERWYGYPPEFDPPVFGSTVYFRHNERDTDKQDMPGHKAIFLGYPSNAPGCYVQDLDMPNKPIRITYDVHDMSFDEDMHGDDKPLLITKEEYELLDQEFKRMQQRKEDKQGHVESMTSEGTDIPQEDISYWHGMQKFAQGLREAFHDSMSPENLGKMIMEKWKSMQLGKAEQPMHYKERKLALRRRERSSGHPHKVHKTALRQVTKSNL